MNNTKAEQKRRSYSIKDKLAVIAEHEEGVAGSGFYALSNKHDAASGTLRGCWQNCQKLQHASKDRQIATRTARRLGGGGRGPKYPKVEERLHLWILDRNAKGLRVNDSYIRLQAQNIYRKLRGPDGPKLQREDHLKNRPTVPDGLIVDVNRMGMWSDEILLDHAKKVLCNRKETQL
ncbi:hypothetical protein PC120_g19670 [Phytophthora cactorum]|nr:hypothetical protein PC120_g19670 [Phytophthora cactorum]